MLGKRVTMSDVARQLNLHQTTVSLALRNHKSIPERTKKRILACAESMGYSRDPALDALNSYRHQTGGKNREYTLAYISDFVGRATFERAEAPFRRLHEGVMEQSRRFGYTLESFFFDPATPERSSRHLNRILKARGIVGVIIGAFRTTTSLIKLDWDEFCCVQIESRHLGMPFTTVSVDQTSTTRKAVRSLVNLGYRRFGLIVGSREENYLDHAFTVGFNGETALHPEIDGRALLILENEKPIDFRRVATWIKKHRLDVIVSNWNTMAEDLHFTGLRVPKDIAFASVDLSGDFPNVAGVMAHHRAVGIKAVEQLAILLKLNNRGVPALRTELLVEGEWYDGPTAPSKK